MAPSAVPHIGGRPRRALVVSHPCVLAVNQAVYVSLESLGWELTLVVPERWRHDYNASPFGPSVSPSLRGDLLSLPILLPGREQRHLYLTRIGRLLRRVRPEIVFLEQETFSLVGLQWSTALTRAGIPFGVQAAENLERSLHPLARIAERRTLAAASFVAARSPKAQSLIAQKAPTALCEVMPHAVPPWTVVERTEDQVFRVGYVGRLVPEKGLRDLVSAFGRLRSPARLVVAGNGELLKELEAVDLGPLEKQFISNLPPERIAEAYAQMDVLVLPSRSTPKWEEQFGRVLVEAMWCGLPVIGSDSGEIPWVIETTGGGVTYREGDVEALAERLTTLRDDPECRARHAVAGRASVERVFSVPAAASQLDAMFERVLHAGQAA